MGTRETEIHKKSGSLKENLKPFHVRTKCRVKMASKDQGDIDARIARIRAANEERERRHREVLADRLEAEKTKSAVNVKSPESGGTKPVESEERFRSPFEANSSTNSSSAPKNSKKPVHERLANSKSNPSREEPARRGRGRLADDDGPPP